MARGRPPAAPIAGMIVLVLLAAACTGDGEPQVQGSPPATSTATVEPTEDPTVEPTETAQPTETTEPSPPTEPVIEDGRHFTFVTKVRRHGADGPTLTFDLAFFLTGDEAIEAAEEDGNLPPDGVIPNDYYIENDNPRLRTVGVSPAVVIRLIDWDHCCDRFQTWSLRRFARMIAADADSAARSPYWLTIDDGAIVRVKEQYLP